MLAQTTLASRNINIPCQRHSGILAALWKKMEGLLMSETSHVPYFEVASYLEVVPKIHPMTRLHTPFPAVLMERVRARAVPRVDCGTTMAIEGHEHIWRKGSKRGSVLRNMLPINMYPILCMSINALSRHFHVHIWDIQLVAKLSSSTGALVLLIFDRLIFLFKEWQITFYKP